MVSVGADGQIGKVKRFASPEGVAGLVAAAGERGAATLAWVNHRAGGTVSSSRTRYSVRALGRTAGHAFAAIRTVATTSDFVRGVAIAADENGRVTLAWSREHYGDDRSVGTNGITSAILATSAQAGRPLPAPQVVAKRGRRYLTPPDVAAANGRVALAWGSAAGRRDVGVQAAVGPSGAIGPPQTVVAKTLKQSSFGLQPVIQVDARPQRHRRRSSTSSPPRRRRRRPSSCSRPPTAPDQRSSRNRRGAKAPAGMGAEGAHRRGHVGRQLVGLRERDAVLAAVRGRARRGRRRRGRRP